MILIKRVINFYIDGFKSMTVGKTLWLIILIKLAIMFLVLRLFFFQPVLSEYDTKEDKANRVIENLTKSID